MSLSDLPVFFKEFLTTFQTTGAIAPSSRGLARVICREVANVQRERAGGRPVRLLEVGPGTGVFTAELCRHLHPGDHLDVVELNERFVRVVREKLQRIALRQGARVEVIHASVADHRPAEPYDHAVSGLPLNNFPPDLVKTLLTHMLGLIRPGGTLSYFEYIGLPRIKRLVSAHQEAARLGQVLAITRRFRKRHGVAQHAVWLNVPPAWVHVLRLPAA